MIGLKLHPEHFGFGNLKQQHDSAAVLYKGFPVWSKYVRGIRFRTHNEPFKVPYVDAKVASAHIFLALVTLGSDQNLDVKYARIYAFGVVGQQFKWHDC
ncbi:uncharacterized protein [Euphorbia lathyris]|uniref:uncharacterized protein isoform X2 n=1 Tax=Euphorbia lathyris TaxID=212925 RepID=UPI003313DAC9